MRVATSSKPGKTEEGGTEDRLLLGNKRCGDNMRVPPDLSLQLKKKPLSVGTSPRHTKNFASTES